jgi:hypothetical protein
MSETQQTWGILPTRGFWHSRPKIGPRFLAFFGGVVVGIIAANILTTAFNMAVVARYAVGGICGVIFSYVGLGIAERIVRSKEGSAVKSRSTSP